jgi:hypothetical protein
VKTIEVGQTIYVNIRNMFLRSEPKLEEYVVTKVNTKSFYARPKDSSYEIRFNRKTMKSTSSLGDCYTAYINPNEYWDKVKLEKEKLLLRTEITKSLNELSIEKLRQIKAIIDA